MRGVNRAHLYKDVGMIPYIMAKDYGWESGLAYIKGNEDIIDDVYEKNVKLHSIDFSKNKFVQWINILNFIKGNAKNYDTINFYHGGRKIYLMAFLFKLLNFRCKIYLKLDLNQDNFEKCTTKSSSIIQISKQIIQNYFLKYLIDIYSVETKKFFKKMKDLPKYKDKLIYIPNGMLVDEENVVNIEKENIILTVGRIGAYEKNHELLLDSIAKINRDNINKWKVYFVGPIVEKKFLEYVEQVYNKKPYLRDIIIFTGNISDKKELYKIYAQAKIFCLTSRWESFGIALLEALFFKNYIITTDYPAAYDLTAGETFGTIIPSEDVKAFTDSLEEVMNGNVNIEVSGTKAQEYVIEYFDWKKIVRKLDQYLV